MKLKKITFISREIDTDMIDFIFWIIFLIEFILGLIIGAVVHGKF